ncbi:putative flavoprotein involved in K+ transport [Arthrobacter sp. SLBN-112]|uniref:flavin-containing monooxygenase n=1 Tax=Arthrobacter sp. SLBN-112 TaxID=2768452 RepID=UPI0011523AF7|nr:NAD(P)/FAD-dependent oxidoreductase [Arthrobacter sp. SLBN-112]TQJ40052.1 putative flavoprotein involved in K+ transport [Arthrobacter sp. SLBN-112]
MVIDCVVVGAGPAGLAASSSLSGLGIEHVVLERARPGETWRTQRWDSLHINNPAFMNTMLGAQDPDTYLTRQEVVQRLEELASRAPMLTGIDVVGLARLDDRWLLRTSEGQLQARSIVVATGGENVPRVPALAGRLPDRIMQRHAATYRKPSDLPEGAVLVVGSAQSGTQITEDLLAAGRRVWLATCPVGRASARYRGRDTLRWLDETGFFEDRPEDLPDPGLVRAVPALRAPHGHDISLQLLAKAGATLTGRLVAVQGDTLAFDDSTAANIAYGDRSAANIRSMIDAHIQAHGLEAPAAEPDPGEPAIEMDPPRQLRLQSAGIGSVIWCTGYTGAFQWLGEGFTDAAGAPLRQGAASPAPGIWFIGLRWLIRRSSGNFVGFPRDAEVIANSIRSFLAAKVP